MNIAIEGCCHGQLDQIYKHIQKSQKTLGIVVDLLLICGDFQALRNNMDMETMHCPRKYQKLGNFYEYYNGTRIPYVTTIFIGGNHQAVNYSRQLYFGGWAAKGIYYLGQSGSIWVKKGNKKIRISGLSGIFNFRDFMNPKLETFPFSESQKISSYHSKQIDIFKIDLLAANTKEQFDIFLSHDWPTSITKSGNEQELLKNKPYFKQQLNKNQLGSPALEYLLHKTHSSYWFSAHLHVKFPSIFKHADNRFTHFLALDKCMRNRDYLQILEFNGHDTNQQVQQLKNKKNPSISIQWDLDWITVLKLTQDLLTANKMIYKFENRKMVLYNKQIFDELSEKFYETKEILRQKLKNQLKIDEQQFRQTVLSGPGNYRFPDSIKINNQTQKLLKQMDINVIKYSDILYYNNQKVKLIVAIQQKQKKQQIQGWEIPEQKQKEKSPINQEIQLDL